jgi:hypothetical protein
MRVINELVEDEYGSVSRTMETCAERKRVALGLRPPRTAADTVQIPP